MRLNHPQITPMPQTGKLASTKLVLSSKKVGDHYPAWHYCLAKHSSSFFLLPPKQEFLTYDSQSIFQGPTSSPEM